MQLSHAAKSMRPSVFATLAERMKRLPSDFLGLHIGDTYRLPPEGARFESLGFDSKLYAYSHPFGVPEFLEALAAKLRSKNGLSEAAADWVQVTCGATQALHCTALTVLDPGDEVLVLAPYWALILGVLRSAGGVPVQVPFFDRLPLDIPATLDGYRTERTRALYFGNPNNPDGKVLTLEQLQALADYARQHDLWIIADEVYEDYLFDGRVHHSIARLAPERTLTSFSFSKSYAMAGNRLGYAVAPPDVMYSLRRVANHTVYNVCATLQKAGLAALHDATFLNESCQAYSEARKVLHEPVRALCPLPEGGAYLFPALESEPAMWDFLHRGLDLGLAMAPGEAFGDEYKHCVRICFTAAPPEGIERAARILAQML